MKLESSLGWTETWLAELQRAYQTKWADRMDDRPLGTKPLFFSDQTPRQILRVRQEFIFHNAVAALMLLKFAATLSDQFAEQQTRVAVFHALNSVT